MARNFDVNNGDCVDLTASSIPSTAAFSWVAVVDVATLTSSRHIFGIKNASFLDYLRVLSVGQFSATIGNTVVTFASPTVTAPTGWLLVAVTKASGSVNARLHVYTFSSDTWTRTNAPSATAGATFTPANAQIGARSDGVQPFSGDIAAVAVYSYALSDDQVSQLPYSLSAWTSLAPGAMWVLDQQDTSQLVLDWTGNGANETAFTSGTSISASSVPILGYGHPVVGRTRQASGGSVSADAALAVTATLTTAATRTATPTAGLAVTATLTAAAAAGPTTESLFTTETPSFTDQSDGTPGITTAVNIKFAKPGTVDVRWYCTSSTGGTWTGLIWRKINGDPDTSGGALVASAAFSGTPVGGDWNTISLGAAVTDTDYYTVGIHNDQGRYVATTHFPAYDVGGGGVTSAGGNATAPSNGTTFTLGSLYQGLFQIDASPAYPGSPGNGSNYFIDVVFTPSGGSTVSAGAALSVTATLTTDAAATKAPSAALAATAALSTDTAKSTSPAAALSATATLAASAGRSALPAAALTATATLTAAADRIAQAAAALSATATLTCAGSATKPAAAALSVTATLAAAGLVGTAPTTADAALTVTATLATGAIRNTFADTALSVAATLTAAASRTTQPAAALAVTVSLTAGPASMVQAGAALAVVVSLLAAATTVPLVGASSPTSNLITATRPGVLATTSRPQTLTTGTPPAT